MDAILQQPALDPPPGVVPDFAHPGGSQAIGYGIVIASSIISTVAVLARLVSSTLAKKFVLEDFLMIIALVGNHFTAMACIQRNKKLSTEHCLRAFSLGTNTSPTILPSIQAFGPTNGIYKTSFSYTSSM